MPLTNDPIMLGRLIQSFRHLEHQNPSIISEDIGRINLGCKICHGRNMECIWNTSGNILDWLYTYLDKYYIHYIIPSMLQSLDISVLRYVCTMVVMPEVLLEYIIFLCGKRRNNDQFQGMFQGLSLRDIPRN